MESDDLRFVELLASCENDALKALRSQQEAWKYELDAIVEQRDNLLKILHTTKEELAEARQADKSAYAVQLRNQAAIIANLADEADANKAERDQAINRLNEARVRVSELAEDLAKIRLLLNDALDTYCNGPGNIEEFVAAVSKALTISA